MLQSIARQLDKVITDHSTLIVIGRLVEYDKFSGLAKVESLNYRYTEPVILEDVIVLNHGNLYENPVTGSVEQPNQAQQHIWLGRAGDLVLLLRISNEVHVLLGTINALKNLPETTRG